MCHGIVNRLIDDERAECTIEDVHHVAKECADNTLPQMTYWWGSLPPVAKLALAAIAQEAADESTYLGVDDIERALAERRRDLERIPSREEIVDAVSALEREQEILEKEDERARFRLDLLRRWIELARPLYDVIHYEHACNGGAGNRDRSGSLAFGGDCCCRKKRFVLPDAAV